MLGIERDRRQAVDFVGVIGWPVAAGSLYGMVAVPALIVPLIYRISICASRAACVTVHASVAFQPDYRAGTCRPRHLFPFTVRSDVSRTVRLPCESFLSETVSLPAIP